MRMILIIIPLLLSSILLRAQSFDFTLTGNVNWTSEGEAELFYFQVENGKINPESFGRTFIVANKFSFEGSIDKPQIMLLSLLNANKQKHSSYMIFVEPANIQVKAYEQKGEDYFDFSGSKNQEMFSKYLKELDSLFYLIKDSRLQPEVSQLNLFQFRQALYKVADEPTLNDLFYMTLYGSLKAIDPKRYIDFYKEVLRFAPKDNSSVWKKAFDHKFMKINKEEQERAKKHQMIYETIKEAKLSNIEGKKIALDSLTDSRYVVILFWEGNCQSCKAELKLIEKLQRKYQTDKRVLFISIISNLSMSDWREINNKLKTDIKCLFDESGLASKLGIKKMPQSYFLRPEGFGGSGGSVRFYLSDLLEVYLKD